MIIKGRKTWRGNAVPDIQVDDEHAHLIAGRSIFMRSGYPAVSVGSRPVRLHRFLWREVHGRCPPMIDHINRNKLDNRFENLRPATKSLNMRNRHLPKESSLPRGVHRRPGCVTMPYEARIRVGGESRSLGKFRDPAEASAAYEAACLEAMRKEVVDATATEPAG
jgi:hypothetical protein